MSMQLTLSTEEYYVYTSLDLLVQKINDHIKTQEYTIIRKQSKKSKFEIFLKVFFCCDRNDQ